MADSIRYLSPSDVQNLLNAIHDPRDKAIVLLFLGAGLFMEELTRLTVKDIDWNSHTLTITGKRPRSIELNDQVFSALTQWSQARLQTPLEQLFLTSKGVKPLSARAVDHVIRKAAKQAGLKEAVNSQVLRQTFAVRLCATGITKAQAKEVLGISDWETVQRYFEANDKQASSDETKPETKEALDQLDTRPGLNRIIGKLFTSDPSLRQAQAPLQADVADADVLIGRDAIIKDITEELQKNRSIVLTGPLGIGKSQVLERMAKNLGPNAIFITSPVPLKTMVIQLANALTPEWKDKLSSRPSLQQLIDHVLSAERMSLPVLIIDQIHKLKASELDLMDRILEKFTVLSAADATDTRLKQLWYRLKSIELTPLSQDDTRLLIRRLTRNLNIRDYELLETRFVTLANGNPLALMEMTRQLQGEKVVTADTIRAVYHDAGVKYQDWSQAVLVLWALVVMSRFVALGMHSFEGYILAGFGTSLFLLVRVMLRK